jgi:tetratricopeptide (TPR) repeat protein
MVLASLIVAMQTFAQKPDSAETHLDRGLDFAHASKLSEAETELQLAAKMAPGNSEVWSTLGTVLAMQKKLGESTQAFRKSLKITPGDLTVRRYLAANLWQLHLYPEARTNLLVVLKSKPNDAGTKLLLGMVSENMGDYATAARMLASVPQEVGKQPESVAALARSYYHLEQKDKARVALTHLSLSSGPQAAFLGAQIADEMQDYETARKLLTSVRSTFPDGPKLEYALALIEYHDRQFARCQKILQCVMASGNKTASMLSLQAWCDYKQGQKSEAVDAFEEAIKLAPEEESNYFDLMKMLMDQHSLPRALQIARRTTSAFPNSANAFEWQGSVETAMSQFTDAIGSYTQAIQLDSSRSNGLLGLAEAQSSAGMSKEADASFESGLKKFPKDPRFKALYAVLLLKQSESGDVPADSRAKQLLRDALALDPSLAEAHYQLGNLALKQGHMAEAQQHLERVAELDASNAQGHFALSRVYRRLGRTEDAAHEMKLYEKLKGIDSQ